MARMLFMVHGMVQGVGYRALVKRAADGLGVSGWVRNSLDGSVEILAVADETTLGKFEVGIYTYDEHGPKVFRIEKIQENAPEFPREYLKEEHKGFMIEKELD